ncbi:MAG: acyl-CoA dehydrogenase C-terminal domain-containing protein, partial [Candidatus Eremiobacteraeota bacterium]|nr:acyl-CoA dehydrogenase C-terminal domain-containing protein [Candidatus Eremiobacteraeota bacterium]
KALDEAASALMRATDWVLAQGSDIGHALAASVPYLQLWGVTVGGWQLARAATISARLLRTNEPHDTFHAEKISTARYYATHALTQHLALEREITRAETVMAIEPEAFASERTRLAAY